MIDQLLPLVVVVALVAAGAAWFRRNNGAAKESAATFSSEDLRRLGVAGGTTTLVLFTAPGCPPCVPAKRVLDEVGARHAVALVVVDVTDHHEVATAHHVYRAPTTFVVDAAGRALARISGVPRHDEVERVLTQMKDLAA